MRRFYEKLSFNFVSDVAPVAGVVRFPNVMTVSPSFPAKTVPEFIAYAKANPDKINHGSSGNGTTQHLAGELFKMMTGVKLTHVPYRGAVAGDDRSARRAGAGLVRALARINQHIKSGKLRALAVTTAKRSDALPDLPSVGEFVAGYEASGWSGLCAPRNTPAEIVGKLNSAVKASLADPRLKARFADLGAATTRRVAGRIRPPDCFRDRKMGESDPLGQHQSGVTSTRLPHTVLSALAVRDVFFGSFASPGRATRLRGMSAIPPIAPELMRWDEQTRWANKLFDHLSSRRCGRRLPSGCGALPCGMVRWR